MNIHICFCLYVAMVIVWQLEIKYLLFYIHVLMVLKMRKYFCNFHNCEVIVKFPLCKK